MTGQGLFRLLKNTRPSFMFWFTCSSLFLLAGAACCLFFGLRKKRKLLLFSGAFLILLLVSAWVLLGHFLTKI